MITFEGRQQLFKNADMIERKARVTYPHISGSKLDVRYYDAYHISRPSFSPLPEFLTNIIIEINRSRHKIQGSMYYFAAMVKEIKRNKLGNCFEDAMLAELIGHINGQSNIYTGEILLKKQNVKKQINVGHAVAFVTNKKVRWDKDYKFKGNEAIIIDPWLGITDFVGNYFAKIRNQYRKYFDKIPNQDFLEYMIGTDSKNVKDYREHKNNSCQHLDFSIKPAHMIYWDKDREEFYRSKFPEFIIDDYQKINLPIKKKVKAKTAKQGRIA